MRVIKIFRIPLVLLLGLLPLASQANEPVKADRSSASQVATIATAAPQLARGRTESERLRVQASAFIMQARLLAQRERTQAALTIYQRAYRLDPAATVALKQIVPLSLELGRIDEATRYAVLLARSQLKDAMMAESLAILLADQMRYEDSLKLYERVLKIREQKSGARSHAMMRFETGRLYFLTSRFDLAADEFEAVLSALDDPNSSLSPAERAAILSRPELTFTLMAESFLEAGRFKAATEMFQRASKAEENAAWLPLQMARVACRSEDTEIARDCLERYLASRSEFAGREPYELLRRLMQTRLQSTASTDPESADEESGTLEKIVGSFRDWLNQDPENVTLRHYVAELVRESGGLEDAARLYQDSLQTEPTLEAYRGLLSVYTQLRDGPRLLATLAIIVRQLKSLDPIADEVSDLVADRPFVNRLFQVAKQQLPADPETGQGIAEACGMIATQVEDFAAADAFFELLEGVAQHSGSESDGYDSQVLMNWGRSLLITGQPRRAQAILLAGLASAATPNERAALHYYLAGAFELDGKTHEALRQARMAADLQPTTPAFKLREAWVLFHAVRLEEAEQAYKDWLEKYDANFEIPGIRDGVRDAKYVLSNLCLKQQRVAEAAEWLEQILDEFPDEHGAMNDLGYILVDQGISLAYGVSLIERAVSADAENGAYRDSLGWAYFRTGDLPRAVEELQIAAELDPADPVILDHLAQALEAYGDRAAAREIWVRLAKRLESADPDPDAEDAALRDRVESALRRLNPSEEPQLTPESARSD